MTNSHHPGQDRDPAHTYKVGYRRPPVHAQFKKGDGRKRPGRPKGQRDVRTVLRKALNERTKIRECNRTRTVTKLDAIILKMINDAHTNPKVQANLIALIKSVGLMEAPDGSPAEQAPVTADDQALIDDFVKRKRVELGLTDPAESQEHSRPKTENSSEGDPS
jgi:hypothetical protein